MMRHYLRPNRSRLLNTFISSYRQRQFLRLRAPSSHPGTATAVADQTEVINNQEHATVIAACGQDTLVICWHPPKPFPYEHTKPIERTEEELKQGEGPLHPDLQLQFKTRRSRNTKTPSWPELQDIFYTHKQAFVPKFRDLRIAETVEPTPRNRNGL